MWEKLFSQHISIWFIKISYFFLKYRKYFETDAKCDEVKVTFSFNRFIGKSLSIQRIFAHIVGSNVTNTNCSKSRKDRWYLRPFNIIDYVVHSITHNIPKNSHMYAQFKADQRGCLVSCIHKKFQLSWTVCIW